MKSNKVLPPNKEEKQKKQTSIKARIRFMDEKEQEEEIKKYMKQHYILSKEKETE